VGRGRTPAIEDPDAEFERRNRFELRVNTKLDELRVLDEARDRLAAQKAAALTPTPFDAGLLEEILARRAEPAHRVDGLIPSQAGTLVVAQRKVGKTTPARSAAPAPATVPSFTPPSASTTKWPA
jgi:hypothetical protein